MQCTRGNWEAIHTTKGEEHVVKYTTPLYSHCIIVLVDFFFSTFSTVKGINAIVFKLFSLSLKCFNWLSYMVNVELPISEKDLLSIVSLLRSVLFYL